MIMKKLSEISKDEDRPVRYDRFYDEVIEYIENEYVISVTPTYSGCPAVKTFQDDIKTQLKKNDIYNSY